MAKLNMLGVIGLFVVGSMALAEHPVQFKVQLLTVDANEGCAVADVDKDGKPDVIAGRNWFHNPDWVARQVRLIDDWNGYVQSNGDAAYDLNGDGLPDIISMDFTSTIVYWYENPGKEKALEGYLWPKHTLADTGQKTNEVCYLNDVTGDGKPEWIVNQWNKNSPSLIWEFATEKRNVAVKQGRKTKQVSKEMPTLIRHEIGTVNGHGIGFGDLNNDGRSDIVFGLGWYECPAGDVLNQAWKYHAAWELHASCPMLVYDVDGDGTNDLVWSKAHDYGIYWWRGLGPDSTGKLKWEEHLIDDSFSQPHCLTRADLDGDGTLELITGKRIRAHNGGDPGSGAPPIMRYYVWNAAKKSFDAYTINQGAVGSGLQIRTVDLDADGDIDIAVAGKEGTQILWNQRK